jgi:hypothetical protein
MGAVTAPKPVQLFRITYQHMRKVNCNQLIWEEERDSYQMPPVDFLAVCFVLAMVLIGTWK